MNIITKLINAGWRGKLRERAEYEQLLAPKEPVTYTKGIPKKIHQTYKNRELPFEIQKNIEKLKRLNPLWEYCFYDDQDIITYIKEQYSPEVLDYYLRIDSSYGAARADLFRYLVLYREGGVYLDIKTTIDKPLDEVLLPDEEFPLMQWDNGTADRYQGEDIIEMKHPNEFQRESYIQWCIISSKGHGFLKEILIQVLSNIDKYNPFLMGIGERGVVQVSGPTTYSYSIYRCLRDGMYPPPI